VLWLDFLARQQHREPGSLAELALDLDRSSGLVGEAMNLRQAEPGTFADRLGREERIEDLAQDVGRDAGAGIFDAHGDKVAALVGRRAIVRADRDRSARWHGVAGIDDE